MGKFKFIATELPGGIIVEPTVFGDARGYFMETFQKEEFAAAGITDEFVQDNQSRSSRGVLRGVHFQKEHTQGKLVRVTKGEVFDVAVDCRPNSATFGQWTGVILSEENKRQFYAERFCPRLSGLERRGGILLQVHRRLRPDLRGRHPL